MLNFPWQTASPLWPGRRSGEATGWLGEGVRVVGSFAEMLFAQSAGLAGAGQNPSCYGQSRGGGVCLHYHAGGNQGFFLSKLFTVFCGYACSYSFDEHDRTASTGYHLDWLGCYVRIVIGVCFDTQNYVRRRNFHVHLLLPPQRVVRFALHVRHRLQRSPTPRSCSRDPVAPSPHTSTSSP